MVCDSLIGESEMVRPNEYEKEINGTHRLTCKVSQTEREENWIGYNMATKCEVFAKIANYPISMALFYEARVGEFVSTYRGLQKLEWAGQLSPSKQQYCVIYKRLGANLEEIFQLFGRKFSLKTALMLGKQLVKLLEGLHENGLIHRCLCPRNIMIGYGNQRRDLYLVGIKNLKKFTESFVYGHIPKTSTNNFIGTLMFASVNAHENTTLSRRDDLESILYMVAYFVMGDLPWSEHVKARIDRKQMMRRIYQAKKDEHSITEEKLPFDLGSLLDYVRSLNFSQQPNYSFIIHHFDTIMEDLGIIDNGVFDWTFTHIPQQLVFQRKH